MNWRTASAAVSFAVALASWTPPSNAQSGDVNAEARVFFERGNRLAAEARRARGARRTQLFEEALEAYVSTVRIVPSRNALFNAAYVLEQLDRGADAFAYYQRYLAIEGLTEQERNQGEARVTALRPNLAIVAITSDPPGATIFVDRLDLAARGQTPAELALSVGEHLVMLRLPHHQDAQQRVEAADGARAEVAVTLMASPVRVTFEVLGAPEAQMSVDGAPIDGAMTRLAPGSHTVRIEAPGRSPVDRNVDVPVGADYTARLSPGATVAASATLVVRSDAAAEVLLDGMPIGRGERIEQRVAPGSHLVTVRAPGRAELRQTMVILGGQTATLDAELGTAGGRRFGVLPHVLLGATAVAAGVFAGMAVRAENRDDEYRADPCQNGEECRAAYQRVEDATRDARILLGVTGALGVTTLIFYLINRREPARARGHVELSAGPRLLGLRGTF